MKALTFVILLGTSTATMAEGFKPWDVRGVHADAGVTPAAAAAVTETSFRPWDRREVASDANEVDAMVGRPGGNVFRPWS